MKFLITERQYRLLKEQVKTTDGFLEIDPDYALKGYVGIHDPSGGAILVPEGTQVNLYTDNTNPDDFPTFKKWRNTNWEWWIPNKQQLKFMTGLHWGQGPTVGKFKLPNGEMYRAVFANEYFTDEYAKPRPDAWKFEGYFDKNGKPYQVPKSPKPLIDHEVKIALITIGAIVGTILCPECWLGIAIAAGTLEVAEEIRHGDLGDAGIAAAFTLLSFVPWSKMFKFKGKVDLDVLQKKLIDKAELTDDEMRFLDELKNDPEYLNQLKLASDNLNSPTVTEAVKLYKKDYIAKFGQESYDNLFRDLVQNKITKDDFVSGLKKATQDTKSLAEFMIDYGIKFSSYELETIESLVKKINLPNANAEEVTQQIKIIGRNGQEEIWTVEVKNFGTDKIWNGKINEASKSVQINLSRVNWYDDSQLRELLTHEIGHAKDPQAYKNFKQNYEYEKTMTKIYSYSKNKQDLDVAYQELSKEMNKVRDEIKNLKKQNPADPRLNDLNIQYSEMSNRLTEIGEARLSLKKPYDQQVAKYETHINEYTVKRGAVLNDFTQRVRQNLPNWGKERMLQTLDVIEQDIRAFRPVTDRYAVFLFGEEYNAFYNVYLWNKPSLRKDFHLGLYNQIQNLKKQLKLF